MKYETVKPTWWSTKIYTRFVLCCVLVWLYTSPVSYTFRVTSWLPQSQRYKKLITWFTGRRWYNNIAKQNKFKQTCVLYWTYCTYNSKLLECSYNSSTARSTTQYILTLRLQWRHNARDSVSNHQPHDCLLNRLFRRRSKKTSKLRVTGLCTGNSPATGEFPAQMASNVENISIWWRHHA